MNNITYCTTDHTVGNTGQLENKHSKSNTSGTGEVKWGVPQMANGCKHNGDTFMETSYIFTMKGDVLYSRITSDKVDQLVLSCQIQYNMPANPYNQQTEQL